MAARLTSIASVVLVALIAIVMAQTSSSPCHTHASRDSTTGSCVCNAGFVGDGVFVCGIAHAFDIALPLNRASTTGAIITLPVQVGASNIRITSIDASNADFALFQTSGSAKAAAIDITRPAPWSVTNANGQVFIELPAGATPGKFSMQYSYSWFGTPASDALVVETYELCDGLDDLAATKYGFTTAPELAEVDVRWLAGSYQLEFDVTAPYEHDSAIVLVDTVDFDSFDGNIRERARGSCSAHAALPASVPFQALFQSAPTATSPGALSGDYLAYPDPTSTGWDVSAVNCSTIKYHRALSLSELGSCNQITMSTGVDPQTNAAIIKYAGSIYIHTLQPADDTASDESAGYAKFSQQFPFELRLLTEFDAVVQASTDQTRIHVVIRYLKLDGGDMVMQVETQVKEAGVEAPVVRMSDGSGNVALVTPDLVSTGPDGAPCLTNGEADICVQRWIYRKPTWADSDNVVYDFQWTLYGTSDVLTVPISLKLRINDVKIVVGKLGDLSLRLYNDLADAVQGASTTKTVQYPWHASERIFMRGDVMLNAADVSSFQISYRELWVCYSPVGGYDITLENGGCLDPVIGDANRVHLVGNGAVQTSLAATGFRAAVNTLENGAASVAAGVSFDAFPLTGEPHVYTIQARVLLQSKATGKKREINTLVRREANSPQAASRLMIVPDAAALPSTGDSVMSSSQLTMIGLGGAGVFAVVGLVVVLAVVARRSRQQHQPVAIDVIGV